MDEELKAYLQDYICSQKKEKLVYSVDKGEVVSPEKNDHFRLLLLLEGQMTIVDNKNTEWTLSGNEMILLAADSQWEFHGVETSYYVLIDYDVNEDMKTLNHILDNKIINRNAQCSYLSFPIPQTLQTILKHLIYYTDNEHCLSTVKKMTPMLLRSFLGQEELSRLLYPIMADKDGKCPPTSVSV